MAHVAEYQGRLEQIINGTYKTGTEYIKLVIFGKKKRGQKEDDLLAVTLINLELLAGICVSNCYLLN